MSNLKDIRKRIGSVKNTQKITRALKLVSAAKLNRSQRERKKLKPYADKQKGLIRDLVGELGDAPSVLFQAKPEVRRVAVLLIASDRGMCGGFNSNLFKLLNRFVQEKKSQGATVDCWTLGRRATQFVNRQGISLAENLGDALAADLMDRVPAIADTFIDGFKGGSYDEVAILSNQFINAITQVPTTQSYLPIAPISDESEDRAAETQIKRERIYEPDQQTLLNYILPRALETQIRQAILESITGEHAARMNAMNNATDNASDMISTLTLDLNRARQAAITAELMEIISGAEALK